MADIIPINVDLNKLFEAKLTYGFDPLKEAIEGLLKNQDLQNQAMRDMLEEQKELSKLKDENKELKDMINGQNERISGLENTIKDHEARIEKLEGTSKNHEDRISELEQKPETKEAPQIVASTVYGTESEPVDKNKELENELKHLKDRVSQTQNNLNDLLKKRNDVISTAQTVETQEGDDDDETRENLQNQLQGIKTRLSKVEDANAELKHNLDNMSISETDKNPALDNEIEFLRQKIKEIEDKLRELRNKSNQRPISAVKETDENSSLINNLSERLEKLENSHESLLRENESNKDKISNNKQDIGELKDQMPDKLDCDIFDQEITYIKELLNQLLEGKNIDVKIPPPSNNSMSTKDQNKMKEMMAKIPELEKMLQDVLERLKRAEGSIIDHDKHLKDHDKQIDEIWEELNKKANQSDLKDLFDRLNNLERDLEKVIQALNSMGGKSNAPVVAALPNNDKRLDALEQKLEILKIDLQGGLRDLNRQLDSVNSRVGNNEKELEKLKEDLLKLMKKVNDIELKVDSLLKSNVPRGEVQMSGIDPEKLDELKKILNELRNDYRNFKNEAHEKFNQVDNELSNKADKEDLERLKKLLLDKLKDLENALNKTKSDLKKALKILNEKLSRIQEPEHPKEDRDDAMFSKKPLLGISCASCDKNVTNMQGMPAEYYSWKKLPPTKDRVPMMGQGFSRMLQSINNEYLGQNHNTSTPMKTTYGGFKEMESVQSQRSKLNRPSSSDRRNIHIDDIETEAASKMLPSIKDPSQR